MNERLSIQFSRGNKALHAVGLTDDGILFAEEIDSTPRSFSMEFDGYDKTSKFMDQVRKNNNWDPYVFLFRSGVEGGRLVFFGVDPWSFPPGNYWLKIRIEG